MKARNIVRGHFGLPHAGRLTRADLTRAVVTATFVLVVLSWLLTFWFASRAGHPSALGAPWWQVGDWRIYAPWSWWTWRSAMAELAPAHPLVVSATDFGRLVPLGALVTGLLSLTSASSKRKNRKDELYGSAHWATPEEVDKTHLLGRDNGVFVGSWIDPRTQTIRYLRHVGPEHVLAVAPTRSGKDVGLIVPTLLTFPGSAVISDPKGESWDTTAGYLHSIGHRVIRFEPSAAPGQTARFNPLAEVRLGTHQERSDAQDVATSWLNGDGKRFEGDGAIWAQSARPLIAAAILHVLYREKLASGPTGALEQVFYELAHPTLTFDEVLAEWSAFSHDPTQTRGWKTPDGKPTQTHPMVASVANNLLGLAAETRASILLSAQAALELLYDDNLAQNLGASDFHLDDIANGAQPTTLYLVYPPTAIDRLAPVFRTMLELLMQRLLARMDYRDGRARSPHAHRVLVPLNEFPLLGRMRTVEAALPICAGFGVTFMLFTQDLQQLRATYGADETLSANCRVRIFYAPNRPETAKAVSEMLGTTTALKTAESASAQGGSSGAGARANVSEHEVGRALLQPDELMRLPSAVRDDNDDKAIEEGDLIVLKTGHAPIYGKQIFFWKDPVLAQRAALRAPGGGRRSAQRPVPRRDHPDPPKSAMPAATASVPTIETQAVKELTRSLSLQQQPWGSLWIDTAPRAVRPASDGRARARAALTPPKPVGAPTEAAPAQTSTALAPVDEPSCTWDENGEVMPACPVPWDGALEDDAHAYEAVMHSDVDAVASENGGDDG